MKTLNSLALTTLFATICFTSPALAADFSKKELERNIAITTESCIKKQKSDSVNDYYSGIQIKEYCECHAKKLYSLITKDELDYANKNKTLDGVKGKIKQSEEYCKAKLSKEWGNPKAADKSKYIALFKSKLYSSCYTGFATDKEPLPDSITKPICLCFGNDLSEKLTPEQMKESDSNPNKYAPLADKVMANCITKLTN